MKKCTVCQEVKAFDCFSKNIRTSDNLTSSCKQCQSEKKRAYREANKEKVAAQKAASYERHKEKHLKRCAEWQRNNKEKKNAINARYRNSHKESIAAHLKIYYEANKEKVAARTSEWGKRTRPERSAMRRKHQALEINRLPSWLTEQDFLRMKCFYQLAAMRTKESGFDWHVDHIVPLRGKLVSGLHVPNNLRVVPASENYAKTNKFTPA